MKRFLLLFILSFAMAAAVSPQASGRVFWKGMVDAKIQLVIRGDKIETKTLAGREYPEGTYSFTSPLPAEAVVVRADQTEGRGKTRVVEQPSQDNNFTATIEVNDEKGGAREYQLEISW
jgi:hypothetical protein